MENTEKANARSETLREIHTMVEDVKRDSEVSLGYMRMMRSQEELTRKERIRAEKAEVRAEKAEERAEAAEAEIKRLREELARREK